MCCYCSVTKSCSILCDPMQHTRLSSPSLFSRVCSNSCPLSWWRHPTISTSVTPSPSLSRVFSASGSFPKSLLITSGGQSIGTLASASVFPMNIQDWISFRIDWFDLAVQGTLNNLQHHNPKASILWCSSFFLIQFSHPYMTSGKTIALTIQFFISKVMSVLFNMMSRFIVAFFQGTSIF